MFKCLICEKDLGFKPENLLIFSTDLMDFTLSLRPLSFSQPREACNTEYKIEIETIERGNIRGLCSKCLSRLLRQLPQVKREILSDRISENLGR